MIFDWMDCAAVLSARNVLENETFRAFVINELTEEVLEQHAFTPLKNRLGQYEWVSDFCRFINNRSNVVQAGLWESGKWIIHGSSYQNRIWSTLKDIRVFTTAPDKDNWIKSTVIHSAATLKATDKVHVTVRSERSGRRFELVKFQPLANRLAAWQWLEDLASHINKQSQYIKAGSLDDSKHVITASAQKLGNFIWLPKGSGITVDWYICERTAVADVVSGRNAFEKERITVFVVDDVSDQEREQITLETLAADTEMRTWTTALCKKVNGKSEYVKAGTYNESGQLSVISGSSYQNRIWTEHRDIRVFTTCPRLDNWEPIKPLLTDEVMTLDERVIVKVRSAATGRLCETLVFAPSKDRLKPALWMRDLSTLINEKSLYLRAGQANAEKELIETIADVYKSFIWAPKNSKLEVTWERCQLQPTAVIRSQRNPVANEKVRLFVLDEATGKELERREYTVPKEVTGNPYDWMVGFCNLINSNSKLVRIGESFQEGKLEATRSGYKNRIWPLGKDLRAFTTSIGLDNWIAAGDFSFDTDLKANDRIVVHVRSEFTGYLYQTLTFSPTLKDKKATAADWTKALCEKLNKECIYLKAGWKNEEKQIVEPVADHQKNMIWVPLNSGLTVEVLNIGDKTRYAAPIEVQAGVDPAKGRPHVKIPFGTLTGNEGKGPSIDIGLCWTSDTGWDLYGFSFMMVGEPVMNKSAVLLASPNGNFECFEPDQLKGTLSFQDFKLVGSDDPISWINSWRVVHKGGVEEYLQPSAVVEKSWFNACAILPQSIIDATGNSMRFSWKTLEDDGMTKPTLNLLESISCGETTVFKSEVVGNTLNCTLYPGQTGQVVFQIDVDAHVDDEFTMDDSMEEEQFWQMMRMYSATFPFGRVLGIKRTSAAGVASLDLKYIGDPENDSARVRSLESAISSDVFEYDGYAVSVYTRKAAGAPDILRQYAYDDRKTTVTTKVGRHLCTSELHFSDNDAITRHIETQGACSTTTAYSRTEDKSTRQLSLETTVTLKKGADSRMEKALTVLDADGNLVKTVEKGITTEWTYYDGAAKLTTSTKTQRVSRVSSVAHGVGTVFDYANPIGWLLNIFGSQGLTWGTEEVRTVTASPNDIKHDKKVFNLPVELECPGDRNYFTVHVESEKVYCGTGDSRVDLSWTFYGYTLLPTREGCENAIKPSTKFTALYPETAFAQKLNTFKAASMSLEKISYVTDIKNKDFGRVLTEESVRLNSDCKELDISRHQTSYSYAFSKQVLTTRMAEKFNLSLEASSAFARDIVSGLQTSATDRQKKQTTRTYDDHGRLTCEVDNAQDSKARQASNFQYHRTRTGHCVTVLLPQGDKRREEYDLNGNQTKLWICGAGFIGWRLLSRTEFDEVGRASIRTEYDYLPDGTLFSRQEQRLHYDDWGRLHYTDLPDGTQAYCEHDPIKRQTLEFLKAGGKIRQKVLSTFDERSNLTRREVQDSAGKAQSWAEYTYDAGSRLIKSKTDQGAESSFTYDPRGRMCTITEGKTFISNEYPVHSPLASVVKAGENENTAVELGSRTMNALSCVTRTTVGGRKVSYKYDGASPLGTRTTEIPALGEAFAKHSVDHRFTRDPRSGAVVEKHVVKGEQSSVTHVYSLRGTLLSFTNAFGQKTAYHYDVCGRRIKALSDEAHNTLSYDAFGTLTEETVWRIAEYSSVKVSYSHDALGQETARSFVIDDKHKLNLKYTYEKGRIKTAQLLNDSTSVSKEDYVYDDQGRLKTWTCDGTQRPTDPWLNETLKKQSFTYDVLGNIQTCISETTGSKKTNTATYAYSDTDKMQPIKISHSEKSCSAVELTYDAEGRLSKNPLNKLVLHYDKDGRQVGSGEKHLAHYDSFGRRVHNEDSYYADCFYYNGNAPYARRGAVRIGDKKTCDHRRTLLLNESGSCVAQQQTLGGGGELEINTFELKDIRGSVIASWRKDKEGFTYLPFTPYGYRPSKEDDLHWLGFTGQPLDRQSGGVYHLGNGYRTYDPITLVFHAPDNPVFSPFGMSGINWYAYCSGDPVNMVDPSGQSHSRIVSQEVVTTHSPFLDDPVINQVFTAACMIALAPVTGGGSMSLGATIGITVVSTGFGIASTLTKEHDPDLSNFLSWSAFAFGLFGQIKGLSRGSVPGVAAAGVRAVRTARTAVANQRLANRGIEQLKTYALYSGNDAFRVSIYLPLTPARSIGTLTGLTRASGHEARLYKDLWGAAGGKLFEQSWADADVLDTYNKAVFPIPGEATSYVRAAHIMNVDSWYLNQQTYKVKNLEGEYCQGLRWSVIPRALRPEG